MLKKKNINWSELEEMLRSPKAESLIKLNDIRYVFGVPRGGMIPAVLLSHIYDLEVITEPRELAEKKDGLLIVDDIVDSGMTVRQYKEIDPNLNFLSLLYKKNASAKPDFYLKEAENDCWYVFPWETEQSTQTRTQERKYGAAEKAV